LSGEEPQVPPSGRTGEQLFQDLHDLGRAIDNLLVAHHGLRASLPDPHPPFDVDFATAVTFYGDRQALLHLWNVCRLTERLRVIWTGKEGT